MQCLTAAHPPSLNFWSRDGTEYIIQQQGKYEFVEKVGSPNFYNTHMTLRILNVTERDFGKYQCLAKNSQGDTKGEISLYELPPKPPRPETTTADDVSQEGDPGTVGYNEGKRHRKNKRRDRQRHKKLSDDYRHYDAPDQGYHHSVLNSSPSMTAQLLIVVATLASSKMIFHIQTGFALSYISCHQRA